MKKPKIVLLSGEAVVVPCKPRKRAKRITDKMRLDWLMAQACNNEPCRCDSGHLRNRTAIDAAIRAEARGRKR